MTTSEPRIFGRFVQKWNARLGWLEDRRTFRSLRIFVHATLIAIALTSGLSCARAQQLEGYSHRHWDVEEGAPSDIRVIAQTLDGFLWLGTSNGLYRFDGNTFEKIQPATYNRWRSNQITALAPAPDGALWVGYDFGGIAVYRGGRLSDANAEKRPSGAIWSIAVGKDGDVWVAVNGNGGARLKRLHQGKWHIYDDSNWLAPEPIQNVFVTSDGAVWIAQLPTILRLAPGAARPDKIAAKAGLATSLAEDEGHAPWLVSSRGLQQLTHPGRRIAIRSQGPNAGAYGQRSLLIEDGVAWIAGNREGLIRLSIAPGEAGEQQTRAVRSGFLFRDREGTIWGGGADGLVKYNRSPILLQRLNGTALTGLATGSGPHKPLYVGTDTGVYQLADGPPRKILNKKNIDGICAGPPNLLWVMAGPRGYLRRNEAWSSYTQPPSPYSASGCAIGPQGQIWEAAPAANFRLNNGRWSLVKAWPSVQFVVSDGSDGLYANQPLHSVLHLEPGATKTLWSGDDISVGFVKLIKRIDSNLYIGGEKGLGRFDGRRFVTLETRFHPWLSGVTGLAVGPADTWLISSDGIIRVAAKDFQHAFDTPEKPLPHYLLGSGTGFVGRNFAYMADDAALDAAGQPWFVTSRGVVRVDPTRIHRNLVPPPVSIRGLTANGRTYADKDITLPPGTSRLQFDFVALSLIDPTRNKYRYKLDGIDESWVQVDSRRQAVYTGLAPGRYIFRVVAANPDGIWNATGASMVVTITPFFWQTWWFRTAIALISIVLLWAFVQWRMRAAAETTRQRIEDRIAVRVHIAQDLHDTLLQGFQGLVLRFQSIVERLPSGHPARVELESTLDRADDVLQEGRDQVRFLREEPKPVDLATMLSQIADDVLQKQLRWSLNETGIARPICAPVADDIARIAKEAIFNCLRHAHASMISIRIFHHPANVFICIADNGTGLDAMVKETGRKDGHYGLVGMRERAQRLGAQIQISDVEPSGTEVRLTLPAKIAYR